MIDNEFDNFVNGKLKDNAVPVPAGLWDKVADAQFDGFISGKLQDHQAPVPADLWEKITDPTPFDSFISGKLKDYTAVIPAGLWEKVRPEEKDDRKGFILFRNPGMAVALAVLLLVGTLGGYRYFSSQKQAANTPGELTIGPGNGKTATGGETQGSGSGNPVTNNDAGRTTSPASDNQPAAPTQESAAKQPAAIEPANEAANATNTATPQVPVTHDASALHRDKKPAETAFALPGASLSSSRKGSSQTRADKDETVNQASTPGSRTNMDPAKNTQLENQANNGSGISQAAADDNNFTFTEPYHTNLLTAVTIPSAPAPFNGMLDLTGRQLSVDKHTSQFKNVVICPSDRKSLNTDWQLEVYGSPDMAFQTVTNNSASASFLLRKDSSESMRIGYTAGLRLVKPITDNILLKTGLQYSQINQKYVYRTENEVKTTTVVSVRTIIRGPGDTVIVRDTSILQQIGYKNNMVVNRFRSFDIPVTVGYQFGNDDLKIGINAGLIVNLSSWYQGVILDSSMATVPLVKGAPDMVYKNKLGLGLYGGISVVKRVTDDMHVFMEPYFRYNLSNMTTPQSSYNQKFSLGGLAVGLRLNLNRQ